MWEKAGYDTQRYDYIQRSVIYVVITINGNRDQVYDRPYQVWYHIVPIQQFFYSQDVSASVTTHLLCSLITPAVLLLFR